MEKEIDNHESRNHWTLVPRSSLPEKVKTIKVIWSFKCKRFPDGTSNEHKARLCAHGSMQQWGKNYWETYSPVLNMLTIFPKRILTWTFGWNYLWDSYLKTIHPKHQDIS
eukprot:321999-Ditylum_brightwellii.AAC.1